MEVIKMNGWRYFVSEKADELDKYRCGKWMLFFSNQEFAMRICREAVEKDIVSEAKCSDIPGKTYSSIFYLNIDDIEGHRKILQFFLDNDLIRKTTKGKLYNIAFKLDEQTKRGEYGEDFVAELKLDSFIDLETGKWKI